jgi:acyl-CoA thioesterase I
MLARLESSVPDETRVVLFQPGSNDARTGISDTVREENITIIQDRLGARGIRVVRVAAAFEAARQGNLQADGIHYTATGHAAIAAHLVEAVINALAR